VTQDKLKLPTHTEIARKGKDLAKERSRQPTQTEIDEMVAAKRAALTMHTNRAREQVLLNQAKQKLHQDEKGEGNVQKLEELNKQLDQLKASEAPSINAAKQEAWSEINQRNRKMRFAQGQAAEALMRAQKARSVSPGKSPRKDVIKPSLGQFLTENGKMRQDANGHYRPESQKVLRLLNKTDAILREYLDKPSAVRVVVESDDEMEGLDDGVGKSLFELALAQYRIDDPIPPVDEYVL